MPIGHDGQERDIVFATFSMETVPDDRATKANGGVPQFMEQEMVLIQIPGQRDEIFRPVEEKDKVRWAQRYEQFKRGVAQELTGIPLSEFATATEPERKTLRTIGIHTVEQIAGLNDDSAQKLHCVALKRKAQDFMKLREDYAKTGVLKAEIEELKKKIKELENGNAPNPVPASAESDGVQPAEHDSFEQQSGQQAVGAARKRGRPRAIDAA